MTTPKISLINNIRNPSNYPRTYTLGITDLGENIHISNESTTTMYPVILLNNMHARLKDGSTMESSHIATLQLPGIIKKSRQIHILHKIITAPLI